MKKIPIKALLSEKRRRISSSEFASPKKEKIFFKK